MLLLTSGGVVMWYLNEPFPESALTIIQNRQGNLRMNMADYVGIFRILLVYSIYVCFAPLAELY